MVYATPAVRCWQPLGPGPAWRDLAVAVRDRGVFTLSGSRHEGGALTVLPPYGAEEVAVAVQRRLVGGGCQVQRLVVTADDVARQWRLEARLAERGDVVVSFPFASPAGIHTPAELADWFVAAVR